MQRNVAAETLSLSANPSGIFGSRVGGVLPRANEEDKGHTFEEGSGGAPAQALTGVP